MKLKRGTCIILHLRNKQICKYRRGSNLRERIWEKNTIGIIVDLQSKYKPAVWGDCKKDQTISLCIKKELPNYKK